MNTKVKKQKRVTIYPDQVLLKTIPNFRERLTENQENFYSSGNKDEANADYAELMNEAYYQALFLAFKKFIDEEKQRNAFTEVRLMAKIEAARELYRK